AQLLGHVADAEPSSRSVREALALALYDAGRYDEARDAFRDLVATDPVDHYALFGYGLAAGRLGKHREAVEQLALAVAMRPDLKHYEQALRRARAALPGRRDA
ncbi:MAG: tetratricopeptide repeat protein, partial [Frankiaceae bacterium]